MEVYINQGSAKNQSWLLEYKGSPGNLSQFEDILFANNDIALGVSVIAVKLGVEGKSRVSYIKITDVYLCRNKFIIKFIIFYNIWYYV